MNPTNVWARPLLYAILGIAVGAFTIGMVWIAVTTNATAKAIRQGQIDNKSTFTLLQDCVVPSPKNECYTRGQKNQAGILSYVEYLNVATTACADAAGQQSPEDIKACTERTLTKLGIPTP